MDSIGTDNIRDSATTPSSPEGVVPTGSVIARSGKNREQQVKQQTRPIALRITSKIREKKTLQLQLSDLWFSLPITKRKR
jgi:hypothetical protein